MPPACRATNMPTVSRPPATRVPRRPPEPCLARFDELKSIGLDAFTKKHDPYWDIPLNENLPQPVIELALPGDSGGTEQVDEFSLSGSAERPRRPRSKKR